MSWCFPRVPFLYFFFPPFFIPLFLSPFRALFVRPQIGDLFMGFSGPTRSAFGFCLKTLTSACHPPLFSRKKVSGHALLLVPTLDFPGIGERGRKKFQFVDSFEPFSNHSFFPVPTNGPRAGLFAVPIFGTLPAFCFSVLCPNHAFPPLRVFFLPYLFPSSCALVMTRSSEPFPLGSMLWSCYGGWILPPVPLTKISPRFPFPPPSSP